MKGPLILSIFPGIDLLGMAFEQEWPKACIVRGPDLLWGGDVKTFHPPPGVFGGVIGGPPCQMFSALSALSLAGNGIPGGQRHGDMIPDFTRVIDEAQPAWWVMENVPRAPDPTPRGYRVQRIALSPRHLGDPQSRLRWFWFGGEAAAAAHMIETAALEPVEWEGAVLAGHGPAMGQRVRGITGRSWPEMARLQGLSDEWVQRMRDEKHLTVHGYKKVIGNGVPLPMGRAVARAVRRALGQ